MITGESERLRAYIEYQNSIAAAASAAAAAAAAAYAATQTGQQVPSVYQPFQAATNPEQGMYQLPIDIQTPPIGQQMQSSLNTGQNIPGVMNPQGFASPAQQPMIAASTHASLSQPVQLVTSPHASFGSPEQQPALQQPRLQQPSLQQSLLQQPSLQQPLLQQPSLQQSSLQQSRLPHPKQPRFVSPVQRSSFDQSAGRPFLSPRGVSSSIQTPGMAQSQFVGARVAMQPRGMSSSSVQRPRPLMHSPRSFGGEKVVRTTFIQPSRVGMGSGSGRPFRRHNVRGGLSEEIVRYYREQVQSNEMMRKKNEVRMILEKAIQDRISPG